MAKVVHSTDELLILEYIDGATMTHLAQTLTQVHRLQSANNSHCQEQNTKIYLQVQVAGVLIASNNLAGFVSQDAMDKMANVKVSHESM